MKRAQQQLQRARRQRKVVVAIERIGGTVCYEFEMDENGLMMAGAEPIVPYWLRDLSDA